MGHERLGVLPKTKRWRAIVAEIAAVDASPNDVPEIARHTLNALGSRYGDLASDATVEVAFGFLVDMARTAAGQQAAVDISTKSTLSLVADLGQRIGATEGSLETAEIVRRAAADAIATWGRENATTQSELFADSVPGGAWRGLGTGAGFCELSRLFFSRLTERYLSYFLDREASAALPNIQAREQFRRQLQAHLGDVSKHSFETTKITQSFAAGWFNKNATTNRPTPAQIRRFLSYAFAKLREDLRREDRL
jgi:hypothetical protein